METNQTNTYLFQMTIPSVQKFISASRKSADLWAGSLIVSYLMKKLLNEVICDYFFTPDKLEIIYPYTTYFFNEKEPIANTPNVAIFIVRNISQKEAEDLVKILENKFKDFAEKLAEFGIEKFLKEEIKDEDIIKAFSEENLNKVRNKINKIKNNKENYKSLAKFQIKDTLKFFIEYIVLNKDYSQTSENLADIINYEKKSQLPNRDYIENFELIKPFEWKYIRGWNNFYGFEKNNKFKTGAIKGVYKCSSCGEHSIIGADLEDWRGNNIWKPLWEANPKYFNRGERLCGVCLVKRYFRDYMQEIEELKEEDLGFPSTSEVSATLFKKEILEYVINNENKNSYFFDDNNLVFLLAKIFKILNINEANVPKKIRGNPVSLLKKILLDNQDKLDSENFNLLQKIVNLDGEWFIEDIWQNPNDYKVAIEEDNNKASQMLSVLKEIYSFLKSNGTEEYSKPSEYYAVILLDGDSIGEKLDIIKNLGNPINYHQRFSKTLSKLSKEFKNIVEKYFGALIYSGGDDVLALVPVEKALKCAKEIQNEFKNILSNEFPTIHIKTTFSMSGAIIYAHHKLPLNYVLNEARKCEEKAKEEGKNRVCLKYIKRSLASVEAVVRWIDIDKIRNLPVNKQFIYQLREFKKVFKFNNHYQSIEDLEPFYQSGYSHRDIAKKIRNLQENLLISLLHGKDIPLSPKEFINLIKRIDVYKIIKANNGNKIKIYDLDKIENLLLVKEEINIY